MSHTFATSFADPTQLVWQDAQLRCRASGTRAKLLRRLSSNGLLEMLSRDGFLVPVEARSSESASETEFCLDIGQPPRLNYWYEWSSAMWKAAALHIIQMLHLLAQCDLTLRTPYPWHLAFSGPRPLYVNPGAIAPFTRYTVRHTVDVLSRFYLNPLLLASGRQYVVARRLVQDFHRGVAPEYFESTKSLSRDIEGRVESLQPVSVLRYLYTLTERMSIPEPPPERLRHYSADASLTLDATWTAKAHCVHRLLNELRPASVLDLGCNTGWYARLASTTIADVVGVDSEDGCIDRLFETVRARGEGVLPLVMDVNDPSPGLGVEYRWFTPACERLASDLVLALAVSHHLVFNGMTLDFQQVVRAVGGFSRKWLLIEWIPFDSQGMTYSAQDYRPGSEEWYHEAAFLEALEAFFGEVVAVMPSAPTGRKLILCRRSPARGECRRGTRAPAA